MHTTARKRSGLVWIISGLFLLVYSGMGLLDIAVPGVEDLVAFMQDASGVYLYAAAFISIFLEGIYVIGNFLPGSTMVLLLAIIAQTGGTFAFLTTIFAIFIGWFLAGCINIFVAARFADRTSTPELATLQVKDRFLTTWYPAFRANYEVAQVVAGIPAWRVFFSSLRVKVVASIAAAIYALILPLFISIEEVSNREGFATVFAVALICFTVGIVLYRRS